MCFLKINSIIYIQFRRNSSKNFDLETDKYGQKLSDIFGGTFDYYLMPE